LIANVGYIIPIEEKNNPKKNAHKGVSKVRAFALVDHIFEMDDEW
jgi:hypothetical protein